MNWNLTTTSFYGEEDAQQERQYEILGAMKKLERLIDKITISQITNSNKIQSNNLQSITERYHENYYQMSSNNSLDIMQELDTFIAYFKNILKLVQDCYENLKLKTSSSDDILYNEFVNLQEKNKRLTEESSELKSRIQDLDKQVEKYAGYLAEFHKTKELVIEKDIIMNSFRENEEALKIKNGNFREQIAQFTKNCSVLNNENILLKKSLEDFSVPKIVDRSSDIEVFHNKFQLALLNGTIIKNDLDLGNNDSHNFEKNKILRTLLGFLQPNDIMEQAKTSRSMKLLVLGRMYTQSYGIKNSNFEEKTIEWTHFQNYAKEVKKYVEQTSKEDNYRKNLKRYLIYDYDINTLVDSYLNDSLEKLDSILCSYSNNQEKEPAKKESKRQKIKNQLLSAWGRTSEKSECNSPMRSPVILLVYKKDHEIFQ